MLNFLLCRPEKINIIFDKFNWQVLELNLQSEVFKFPLPFIQFLLDWIEMEVICDFVPVHKWFLEIIIQVIIR